MSFPEDLGTIACRCVAERGRPVLAVSHAGGDWQMYCGFDNHDFQSKAAMANELLVVHIARLAGQDATLNEVSDLPVDMGAERSAVGMEWIRFSDSDEDSDE